LARTLAFKRSSVRACFCSRFVFIALINDGFSAIRNIESESFSSSRFATPVYPKTLTQLCIVHLVRASLRYVSSTDRKAVVEALKAIYQSATAEEAQRELDAFEASWGAKYKSVVRLWRGNWDNVIPFFQFLPEIRKVIYTTNAIESLNMVMRKYTRNRRIFPNDDAALKALFMAIREASKNWKMIHHWKPALQSFQLMFGEERVPLAAL